MKILNFSLITAFVLTLVSWSAYNNDSATSAEGTTYTLNIEKSKLAWKGSMNPEYFHIGSVAFTEGSIEATDNTIISGSFALDMSTIQAEDESLSAEKKANLTGHLKSADYFDAAQFPQITIEVGALKAGMLETTISVLGHSMKQSLPVTANFSGNEALIAGSFAVDFSDLKIKGMQPREGKDGHVLPIINFDLNLVLSK
jgi:polyisoprenoid-binding protein YceI